MFLGLGCLGALRIAACDMLGALGLGGGGELLRRLQKTSATSAFDALCNVVQGFCNLTVAPTRIDSSKGCRLGHKGNRTSDYSSRILLLSHRATYQHKISRRAGGLFSFY